ncbi:hypothetical protein HB117_14195 [Escherichia coli]|nr:hypothetical protein HB117_14195 [Escherichia coli]
MNISEQQLSNMMVAVTIALQPLVRVLLRVTAVEWADQNYYLPKESSYGEGGMENAAVSGRHHELHGQ